MSGGSAGARAAVSSQGVFTGQFDGNMAKCRLIGGKMKLQQFDLFQQALSNAVIKFCTNVPEDVQALIINMEEVKMDEPDMPDMPDNSLLSGIKADLHKLICIDDMQRCKKCQLYYKSNKSTMCNIADMIVL